MNLITRSSSNAIGESICSDLVEGRPGFVKLEGEPKQALLAARGEVRKFFIQDLETKRSFADPSFNFGFREFGRQFSAVPDRPDLNESFVYRSNSGDGIPNEHLLEGFLPALKNYWKFCASLCEDILSNLADFYGASVTIDFNESSYVETNWYQALSSRDLLQDRHEDGHIFTLAHASNRGLEVEISGNMHPVDFDEVDLVVMPGSLLTELTAGEVEPIYHQVRNHKLPERSAILFLANPPLNKPLYPLNKSGGTDIADLARKKGAMFGLPDAP